MIDCLGWIMTEGKGKIERRGNRAGGTRLREKVQLKVRKEKKRKEKSFQNVKFIQDRHSFFISSSSPLPLLPTRRRSAGSRGKRSCVCERDELRNCIQLNFELFSAFSAREKVLKHLQFVHAIFFFFFFFYFFFFFMQFSTEAI